MAFTYVTVTHTFEDADDTPAAGVVEFTPIAPMRNDITVVAAPVKATLTTGGAMSQKLAANTDPGTTPTGTVYKVVERLTGQTPVTYYVQVPHDQGPNLDLRTLAGWEGGTPGGGGGTGSVNSVNAIPPDGGGNVTLSAADVGAQLASAALTRLAHGPVTLTAVSGTVTPDATLGYGPHRYAATSNVTLAPPTGGSDGQPLEVQVVASGGDWVLTVAGGTVTVTSGTTWWGHFSYNQGRDEWLLDDSSGGSVVSSGNPLNILTPITLAYASTVTPNASTGASFRITATGDLTLAAPSNGTDGQLVVVEVIASGGTRTLSFTGGATAVTIPSGGGWFGEFRYSQPRDVWAFRDGLA